MCKKLNSIMWNRILSTFWWILPRMRY